MTTRSSGPGASVTNVSTTLLPSGANVNNVPGGVKAECSNCGATHTPLWHRGLNNELNCNAPSLPSLRLLCWHGPI
jgi:GATA-binding protein